ncbi:MAG TPA: hypothetical protein VM865_03135 [Acidobacteriaceae bacterium]|jgi:hypothetical protein|nr:hypothetical protein [Acidobacteriaceae bacterium]
MEASAHEARVIHVVVRTFAGLCAAALLVYPADWMVWRLRVAAGGGMGSVRVSQFTVAELKGNKEMYYPEGVWRRRAAGRCFRRAEGARAGGCDATPR